MAAPKALLAWGRKTDEAQKRWARQAVDGWARMAQFSQPLKWGDVEDAVMKRDYPPLPGRSYRVEPFRADLLGPGIKCTSVTRLNGACTS